MECLQDIITEFDEAYADNLTFQYWRKYMKLVFILLRFTRALREGDWQLYLSAFSEMLPHFVAFDHTNYTRWGSIFLADMMQLELVAPEVFEGFIAGDFVTKETDNNFNQIPDDQAIEHVNRKSKVSSGLVGVIHSETARAKWCLANNDMAQLAEDTKSMMGVTDHREHDDEAEDPHTDLSPSRLNKDQDVIDNIRFQLIF